jgi:hypothetical protein
MTRKYASNAERQSAYRERVTQKAEDSKPILPDTNELENLVDYFKRITGLEPIESQIDILNCLQDPSIKSTAISAGRGYSKTLLASIASLWYSDVYSTYTKQPIDVLLISSQSTIYNRVDTVFRNHPELKQRLRNLGRSLEIPIKSFQFKDNWSQVFRIVPTTNSIRSQRCSLLIIDEAASISDNIINVALSCPSGSLNKTILISTPHKEHSMFNSIIKSQPKGWTIKQYPSTLCSWMEQTLERLKAQMEIGKFTPEEWAVEVEARVPEIEEQSRFDAKDVMSIVQKGIGLIGSTESKIVAGLDWGYGKNNRSLLVLVIAEKLRTKYNIIKVSTWNSDTINNAFSEIAKILSEYNPHRINADSKPTEFRGTIEAQGLKLKINYIDLSKRYIEGQEKEKTTKLPFEKETGITYKQIATNNLSSLIRTRCIAIDSKEEALIEELKNYREGMQYGDDRVQALSLAVTDFPQKSAYSGMVYFSDDLMNKPIWMRFIKPNSNRRF